MQFAFCTEYSEKFRYGSLNIYIVYKSIVEDGVSDWKYDPETRIYRGKSGGADVAELADAQDLGSCPNRVGVQLSPSAYEIAFSS